MFYLSMRKQLTSNENPFDSTRFRCYTKQAHRTFLTQNFGKTSVISLLLLVENEREEQILKLAFEQNGLKVILSKPTFQNYILILQYSPDVVIMELPHLCSEQFNFASRIRSLKKNRQLPIIGYGNKTEEMIKNGMAQNGINAYIERPLKFRIMMNTIMRLLKPFNKQLESKPVPNDKEKDLELILNSSVTASQKIEAMIKHVSTLMAFPFTVAKVLQIAQNQKTGAADLAHAISADPAVAAHLLKIANSVFFASANRRINSLKDAVVRIGFFETKKIIMSMTVMKLFDSKNKNLGFDRTDFWYHSLSSAIISEYVAKLMGDINTEEAFLTGLLHDLGIIILDEFLSPVFEKVLVETSRNGGHFIERETELIKVNHIDLIAGLFPIWKIPQDITDAVVLQYRLNEFKEQLDTPGKKMSLCVTVGNILSKTLRLGRECDEFILPLENWVLQRAKLPNGISRNFINHITNELGVYRNFLGLEKRDYSSNCTIENTSEVHIGMINPAGNLFNAPFIYLTKEGFNVKQITIKENKVSEHDGKFDMILIWNGSLMTTETLNACSHIVKFTPENESSNENIKFAPILMIGSEESSSGNLPENCSFMLNKFDIRELDVNIDDILKGKVVRPKMTVGQDSISK